MKIDLAVIRSNNNRQLSPKTTTKPPMTKATTYVAYPLGYIPHQINFGVATRNVVISKLNTIEHLPCAHCGKTMIPPEALNNLEEMIKNQDLTTFASNAINYVNLFKNSMTSVNLEVFEKLKAFHSTHKYMTLYDVMKEFRPESVKRLNNIQISIINSIEELANQLPSEQRDLIKKFADDARSVIKNNENSLPFDKKSFLKKIKRGLTFLDNEDKSILLLYKENQSNLLKLLPSTVKSPDSFIVRYSDALQTESRKGNPISAEEAIIKRNLGIAQRFLLDTIMSDDHLVSKAKLKECKSKTKNKIGNLVMLCKGCNTEKSDDELSDVIEQELLKPNGKDIIANTKKQIEVIEKSLESKPDEDIKK